MKGLIIEANEAVAKPSQICHSAHNDRDFCYYRPAPSPFEGKFVKVVATIQRTKQRGYVKTALVVPNGVPPNEQLFWQPQPQPEAP